MRAEIIGDPGARTGPREPPGMMERVRFFTRGWHSGELPDDEAEQVLRDYSVYVEAISGRLSKQMIALARDVDLHDAVIERIEWAPAERRLAIGLVTRPSTNTGTQSVYLTYLDALLGERPIGTLREVARDRATEILYSEVDCDEEDRFVHRLLLWPRDEVSITFGKLTLELQNRPDDRVHLGGYFVEVSDE